MTRQEANMKIIEKIRAVAAKYPDWRFHQILQNVNVTDRKGGDKWYEESVETLEKMSVM